MTQFFHGTHSATLAPAVAGRPICLTVDPDVAAAYGSHVFAVIAPDGEYADEDAVIEAAMDLDCDPGERGWEYLERAAVRAELARRGYVGADVEDCLPGTDGSRREDQHDCRWVFDGSTVRVIGPVP